MLGKVLNFSWSRREDADFYRTLISFGVELDSDGQPDWAHFKVLARLDSKYDQTVSDHFAAYMAMCKRVCHKSMAKEEGSANIGIKFGSIRRFSYFS